MRDTTRRRRAARLPPTRHGEASTPPGSMLDIVAARHALPLFFHEINTIPRMVEQRRERRRAAGFSGDASGTRRRY